MILRASAVAAGLAALALAACKPVAPAPAPAEPAPPVVAQAADCPLSSPAQGTPERTAALDAVRPTVEAMAGKPVEFVVTRLDVACDYARLIANPKAKSGADQYETIDAMLVRKDGKWELGLMAAGEEDSPPAGEQYKAKYADVPAALVN